MSKNDHFGDRMKEYESVETARKFMPLLPIYARLDGRNFSKFTQGLERPYDERFKDLMVQTTTYIVQETNAIAGYCQSDEISLLYYQDKYDSEIFFGGKIFKFTSILASMATSFFVNNVTDFLPEKAGHNAQFDARVFQLPNKVEAANAFLWREKDATKNAISSAARTVYSHNELHRKNGSEMQEMLWQKGINFNDYPPFFKRGTFVRRIEVEYSPEQMTDIPEHVRPSHPVRRKVVKEFDMPSFGSVENRVEVLFDGEEPRKTDDYK